MPLFRSHKCKAMSLVEMMISIAVFSLIAVFVVVVTLTVARRSTSTLSQLPAEHNAFRSVDFMRRHLLPAEFGTVQISNDQKGLTFRSIGAANESGIYFDTDAKKCIYDPNLTAEGDEVEWGRNLDGTFEFGDNPRRIQITTWADSRNGRNEQRRMLYEEVITIRN